MSRKVKEIIRAASLRDELSFMSFRHGGFTEAGDAELTDREIMAQGRHRSRKVLPRYKDLDALNAQLIAKDLLPKDDVLRKTIDDRVSAIDWGAK